MIIDQRADMRQTIRHGEKDKDQIVTIAWTVVEDKVGENEIVLVYVQLDVVNSFLDPFSILTKQSKQLPRSAYISSEAVAPVMISTNSPVITACRVLLYRMVNRLIMSPAFLDAF